MILKDWTLVSFGLLELIKCPEYVSGFLFWVFGLWILANGIRCEIKKYLVRDRYYL